MNITQVRTQSDGRWMIEATNHKDVVRVVSAESPRPELKAAMAGLARVVAEVCDIPDDWASDGLTVTGLRVVDWSGDNRRVRLSASKALDTLRDAFSFVTPPAWERSMDGHGGLSPESVRAIGTALAEAKAYMDGQRAQGTLPV